MALSNADNHATEPVKEPTAAPVVEIGGEDVTEHVAKAAGLPKAKKTAKTKAEPEPAPILAKAFTSGNAEVHNLIAERAISDDDAHVAAVDAKLAALGYAI